MAPNQKELHLHGQTTNHKRNELKFPGIVQNLIQSQFLTGKHQSSRAKKLIYLQSDELTQRKCTHIVHCRSAQ